MSDEITELDEPEELAAGELPDWVVPGAKVAHWGNKTYYETTIEKVLKRDIVLADPQFPRFRRDLDRRSATGRKTLHNRSLPPYHYERVTGSTWELRHSYLAEIDNPIAIKQKKIAKRRQAEGRLEIAVRHYQNRAQARNQTTARETRSDFELVSAITKASMTLAGLIDDE